MNDPLMRELRPVVERLVRESVTVFPQRIDVHVHGVGVDERLARIEKKLDTLSRKETQQMALAQELLDKITAQTTQIDNVKALIEAWKADNLITDEQEAQLKSMLDTNSTKLEEALAAGVTPPPTP